MRRNMSARWNVVQKCSETQKKWRKDGRISFKIMSDRTFMNKVFKYFGNAWIGTRRKFQLLAFLHTSLHIFQSPRANNMAQNFLFGALPYFFCKNSMFSTCNVFYRKNREVFLGEVWGPRKKKFLSIVAIVFHSHYVRHVEVIYIVGIGKQMECHKR